MKIRFYQEYDTLLSPSTQECFNHVENDSTQIPNPVV